MTNADPALKLDRSATFCRPPQEREFVLSHPKGQGEPGSPPGLPPSIRKDGEPGWAAGLRKLYKSVVEEPLPDSFDDILKKLDESDES
ncbi:NepR family anti-sigma factor [Novosphingobium sp. 9U]|uniref:NepR family anti-sigma factor n=1 Tax=Novosphingobium sp. 9U TaxID=2653158 RepID=UPI001F2D5CFE|nr:NepR family anti-sigma factor [Novosphingobium sp. 9U]